MGQSVWQPLTQTERYRALDAIRGVSLFGVLLVNLLTLFRVSLFQHILTFHTHPGWANHLVDELVSGLVEFKAFTLFSLMFGVGVAIQAERAVARGVKLNRFLVRRFLVLLALGLCHLLLIWNGDILVLYAVCGLLLVPVLRLPALGLAAIGAAVILLPFFVPLGIAFPGGDVLRVHAAEATRVYSQGGFMEILTFRWYETRRMILPLLLGSLPRTAGLMLWGVSAWRSGVLRDPERHSGLLRAIFLGAGLTGGITAALHAYSRSYGLPFDIPFPDLSSNIPLAFAYGAGLLLWLSRAPASAFTAALAAAGQMALTTTRKTLF